MSLPHIIAPRPPRRFIEGHPWLYSNEITMDVRAKAFPPGSLVRVTDSRGHFHAIAHFNPRTLIAVRALTRAGELLGEDFWQRRLKSALELRARLFDKPFYRLCHAEADGVPGLIIDRFDDVYVLQANTAGMDKALDDIVAMMQKLFSPKGIYLRGDSASRELEGLEKKNAVLFGTVPDRIHVEENGVTYLADLQSGQKTGWYFDQRRNHALMAEFVKGKTVLDLYSHSGGFGLLAAKMGAKHVICVDSSKPALALAEEAAKANGLKNISFVQEDVFEYCEKESAVFDCVIADPPPFARSRKDVVTAAHGYRKLARLASRRTAKEGMLFIFSCSHAITRERFDQECVKGVHEPNWRKLRVLARTGADMDHPVHPQMEESAYLKGLLLRLD